MYKYLCIALYYLLVCNEHYPSREILYSETCLERPLALETACFEGPHVSGGRSYISM